MVKKQNNHDGSTKAWNELNTTNFSSIQAITEIETDEQFPDLTRGTFDMGLALLTSNPPSSQTSRREI